MTSSVPIHDDDQDPHSRRLRGGRISAAFQTYFITKCVDERRETLAVPAAAEIVIESLAHARRKGEIKLLAFVVMPDHYHGVFVLLPDHDLPDLMRRVGSHTANRIRRTLDLDLHVWQADGFYDRACRNDKEVLDALEHVQHNPVRKALVAVAQDWPFSSAHPKSAGDSGLGLVGRSVIRADFM
jgi:putative transposase